MARLWSTRKSSEKLASFSGEAGEASFSELFCAQQTLISRAFSRFSGRQTRYHSWRVRVGFGKPRKSWLGLQRRQGRLAFPSFSRLHKRSFLRVFLGFPVDKHAVTGKKSSALRPLRSCRMSLLPARSRTPSRSVPRPRGARNRSAIVRSSLCGKMWKGSFSKRRNRFSP